MNANLYALQRQLGILPGGAPEQPANPALQELLGQIAPLLEAALGKAAPTPRQPGSRTRELLHQLEQGKQEPANPGMPERPDAAELLRRATPAELPFATPPEEKPKILEIAAKRSKTGRLFGSIITLSNGRTFETTVTARDELGRATCIDFDKRFQLRTVRDPEGKIVKMVPAEGYGGAPGKFGKLT